MTETGSTSGRPKRLAPALAHQALALVLTAAAALATLALPSDRPGPRTLFFYPAVFASAALGGLAAGVGTTIASALAIAWLFVEPSGAIHLTAADEALELGIFCAMGLGIAWTVDRRATERRRAVAAADAATRALAVRDEVLAVVAHDLKNPLQTITLSSTLLTTGEPDAMHVHADRIRRSAERAARLVANLLDAAAMDAGTFHVEARRCALRSILAEAIVAFEPLADMRDIELRAPPAPDVTIACDADRLLQALCNVIANALQYTPPHGTVDVVTEMVDGALRITVRDSGPGMDPEQAAHVFQRFWRGRKGPGGSGLGLFIAKGIVEAHGGRIALVTRPGSGTEVTIELPSHGRGRLLASEPEARRGEEPRPPIH